MSTSTQFRTPTFVDLDVKVIVEFFYMENKVPWKVPSMPEQVRTVQEMLTVADITKWVWTKNSLVCTILQNNKLSQINDMFTSVYDDTTGERLMHFFMNSPKHTRIWWDQSYANVHPKREHWPWDPPKLYIMLGSGYDGTILERDAAPVLLRVKRYQEEAVVRNRFQKVEPLLNDYVAGLGPRPASPSVSPPEAVGTPRNSPDKSRASSADTVKANPSRTQAEGSSTE